MAALEEREKGSGVKHLPSQSSSGMKSKTTYAGMAKEDIQLQKRLEKLREKTPAESMIVISYGLYSLTGV